MKEIKSAECINCQICVLDCPKTGALENKLGKKKLKPVIVIVLLLALYFGSIFAFQVAGIYQLTPNRVSASESIGFAEVKGYMSITDAAKATKTDIKEFYKIFAIPKTVPAQTKMKEIISIVPEYDFEKVKLSFE